MPSLQQQTAGADDAPEDLVRFQFFRDVAAELVVLEERTEEEAGVRRLRSERVDEDVDPALDALRRRSPGGEAPHHHGLDARENARDHRRVELGLAVEVVEERRLAEADRFRDFGEADAGEAAAARTALRR